ncbi:unnamed protein product [Nesidiocoris tenuis]|uniref:Uncharacterized protein n=1 Tax=Nesidiocoris tenuis TaxID=355587 RepID=A0A6H5HDZ9_9HEMI|nr:unnamed protein product [Nesidiocoris tenuis]
MFPAIDQNPCHDHESFGLPQLKFQRPHDFSHFHSLSCDVLDAINFLDQYLHVLESLRLRRALISDVEVMKLFVSVVIQLRNNVGKNTLLAHCVHEESETFNLPKCYIPSTKLREPEVPGWFSLHANDPSNFGRGADDSIEISLSRKPLGRLTVNKTDGETSFCVFVPESNKGIAFFASDDMHATFGYRQPLEVAPYVSSVCRPWKILKSDDDAHLVRFTTPNRVEVDILSKQNTKKRCRFRRELENCKIPVGKFETFANYNLGTFWD